MQRITCATAVCLYVSPTLQNTIIEDGREAHISHNAFILDCVGNTGAGKAPRPVSPGNFERTKRRIALPYEIPLPAEPARALMSRLAEFGHSFHQSTSYLVNHGQKYILKYANFELYKPYICETLDLISYCFFIY